MSELTSKEIVPSAKDLIDSLARFADHNELCPRGQWKPEDEEDFDMPECTCGLELLLNHASVFVQQWQPASAHEPCTVPMVELQKVSDALDEALGPDYFHTVAGLIEELSEGARPAQPPILTLEQAYELGWRAASDWAHRSDLVHDIDSPAYLEDLRSALTKIPAPAIACTFCGATGGGHRPECSRA